MAREIWFPLAAIAIVTMTVAAMFLVTDRRIGQWIGVAGVFATAVPLVLPAVLRRRLLRARLERLAGVSDAELSEQYCRFGYHSSQVCALRYQLCDAFGVSDLATRIGPTTVLFDVFGGGFVLDDDLYDRLAVAGAKGRALTGRVVDLSRCATLDDYIHAHLALRSEE